MLDAGRLVVAGATDSLLERTGTLTVEVGDGSPALAAALAARGLSVEAGDGLVEVTVGGDADLDAVRDAVVELGLPLHRLTSRAGTLDEAFLTPAAGPTIRAEA